MKKLIFLVAAVLVSTYSFADIQSLSLNDPSQLEALRSAWQNHQSIQPKSITDDMTMVYGGADIANDQRFSTHQRFIV